MTIQQLAMGVAIALLCTANAQAGGEICGDVNDSGSVSPADALLVLKDSVGQDVKLSCPSIEALTACNADLSDANADLAVCLGDSCGDGVVNAVGEQCDESDLGGASCASLGYGLGSLSCDKDCNFDASDCEPCTGVVFKGTCWFFGTTGQSCTQVCSSAGKVYDDATRTVAGSDGTDDNCEFLLDELGAPGTGLDFPSFDCGSSFPNGCSEEDDARGRCASPTTLSTGDGGNTARVCACTDECAGVAYAGACWFLGKTGQSCDQVCAGKGKAYDDATRTVAGSQGTDPACESLLDALDAPGTGLEFPSFACSIPNGCAEEEGTRGRCATPVTTSDASHGDAMRVCACR